jgi:tRNA pseudouridine38-40 synthase
MEERDKGQYMRYFFRVEYDGARYGGWQAQTNASSVQETIADSFSTVTREQCSITGAGRTDAGVHARGQAAHIDLQSPIDARKCELSVNAVLPDDICIYHLQPAPDDFNARYSAKMRRYVYYMTLRKKPLSFKKVWMVFYEVNWDKVRSCAQVLPGKHDFTAFCAKGSGAKTMTCTIRRAELESIADGYSFTIEADRFLYKMVRTIVGTLIDMGRGKITDSMEEIIKSKDRKKAGETAPACGLMLDYVEYDGID